MSDKPLWLAAAPALFLMFWSGGYVVAKFGLMHAEPFTLLTMRFALVVVAMGVLAVVTGARIPRSGRDLAHIAIVGVLMQSVYFGFMYLAFREGVASGTVALMASLQPIVIAVAAPYWSGETVRRLQWAGIGLGLLGTVIVIAARTEIATPSSLGLGYCLIALAGMSLATLWEKRFGKGHNPIATSVIGFTAALVVMTPLALMLEEQRIDWSFGLAWSLAYLVIANSVIATSLLLAMIRYGAVSKVSSLMFLVPPGAALLAWLTLNEAMPPLAWAGMAVAAVGVWLVTRPARA